MLAAWLPAQAMSQTQSQKPSQKPPLDCHMGPITKTYGGTSWLVYSCDDNGSVVFLSAPGSPAFPFYFVMYATEKGRRIEGEGTGDKKVTDVVVEELQRLSKADVAALIAQTKQVPKSN
jgi:hypothetical protein